MTERWKSYFEKQGIFGQSWLKAAINHWGFHEILFGMIQRHCPPPARILDVGCGSGFSDLYLQSSGYEVTGVDNDARIVEFARSMAAQLAIDTRFDHADAFDLTIYYERFDFVYSCGVLEHFDREVTVRLLQEQSRCAPLVMIQTPTRYTAYAEKITDERIYTIRQLSQIVEDAGLSVRAAFGYGDITATIAQVWLRRLLPRAVYRFLQNHGFAYSIAVLGRLEAV